MSIKPGVLCYLIRSEERPEWVGRVVTALDAPRERKALHRDGTLVVGLGVAIEAPWLPPRKEGQLWVVDPDRLRPIAGPGVVDEVEADQNRFQKTTVLRR